MPCFLLRIAFVAMVACACVAELIFSPSDASFLISVSMSWQALSTTALKFLFRGSFSLMTMCKSLNCLLFLAADMNPGAQSFTTVIWPGCQIGVVRAIIPDFKSSAFSDGMSVRGVRDVKWSVRIRMFCRGI